jgi:hypothetical protein
MMKNFISWCWELNFKFFAYTVGNALFAIVYLISFVVLPLKSTVVEYEEKTSSGMELTEKARWFA